MFNEKLKALKARKHHMEDDGLYLEMIRSGAITFSDEDAYEPDYSGCDAAVAEVRVLITEGDRLFGEGYRLRSTSRSTMPGNLDVPENAIEWLLHPAGHIATSEAYRIWYVVKSRTWNVGYQINKLIDEDAGDGA